jgi:DNA-binding Xre family transcriptional regulator
MALPEVHMGRVKVARFRTNVRQLILDKSAREGRRITYKEVANDIGLSEITISRWARNEIERIDLSMIKLLCDYFNCTFEELVQYDPEE